jgi:ribosomal protein S18 acetylase RimI-like enzyme
VALSFDHAGVDDLAELVALEAACFPASDRFAPRIWRHLLGRSAKRGTALTLLVRERGKVLGTIVGLYRRGSKVARIYSLAVSPKARGRGLGRRLIRALLERSPARCATVSLEVRRDNPARELYDRLGLRVVSVLPRYYADSAPGVRYRGARKAVLAACRGR